MICSQKKPQRLGDSEEKILIGIEVLLHGLVCSKDGSMTYFVKRFDRVGRGGKVAVEDFAQLSGHGRETKYHSSMERVAHIIFNPEP